MKLVRFEDGKWGVRKGWLTYRFADMNYTGDWWFLPEYVDEYAKGTEAQARELLAKLTHTKLTHNALAHKVVKCNYNGHK